MTEENLSFYWNQESYLRVAERALADHFQPDQLLAFYSKIQTPTRKNHFLRAASTYYYIVKRGDWIVDAEDCNPLIDYFTNSYKAIGLFAVIESLTDSSFKPFSVWLRSEANFPIIKADLAALEDRYNDTHGATRRCVTFFKGLSTEKQAELCGAVEIDEKPIGSIKLLAQFLYQIRSSFVHGAEVVLSLSGPMRDSYRDKPLYTKLTMPLLCSAFEEGLIAYFTEKTQTVDPGSMPPTTVQLGSA